MKRPEKQYQYLVSGVCDLSYTIRTTTEAGPAGQGVGKCPWRFNTMIESPIPLTDDEVRARVKPPIPGYFVATPSLLRVDLVSNPLPVPEKPKPDAPKERA
jgi:hypothetical protein